MRQLFEQFRKFGLRVNRDKYHFCCRQVKFLGHLVDEHGLHPDPDKVKPNVKLPTPCTFKQLMSFLQTCSRFRRFIPNFAKYAEPLSRLTYKYIEEPILQQADDSRPFILRLESSAFPFGACHLQGDRGEEHTVDYASRLLTLAERNYSITEREALAVVWAMNKFRGCQRPLANTMALKTPYRTLGPLGTAVAVL